MNGEVSNSSGHSRRRPSKLRNIALGIVLGSAGSIFGILIVMAMRGERLPEITMEILDAAAAKWAANGPADYDLDIQQSGINPGAIHVEVRKGEVTAMTLNGNPTRQHLWDDWSVPGLFGVIRRDVEVCMPDVNKKLSAKSESGESGVAAKPDIVVPRGTFDAKYGYPIKYHRVTPTGADAEWRVTKIQAK
jgi:hypothetical protein